MTFLLHIEEGSGFVGFLSSVLLDGILDTLKIIPFLFLTYLLMEFIEHKASGKFKNIMTHQGGLGPLFMGLLGAVPQCGFSTAAANFYTGRVITLGSLIAVFLSTSDEMLPILVSGNVPPLSVLYIILYKAAVGILVGFGIDIVLKLLHRERREINIDEICENDGCNCENGIFRSALHHTLSVGLFVLCITLVINTLIFFIGQESIGKILYDKPVLSHLIAALIGLIPNCAASVALTDLALHGFITVGSMLSGLFSGAGVGLLVLLRVNKNRRENLIIILMLVLFGTLFGLLADLIGFSALIP